MVTHGFSLVFDLPLCHRRQQCRITPAPFLVGDEEAPIVDMQSYRNQGVRIFLHNSGDFLIQGGTFADKQIGVYVDQAPSIRNVGARFVGITPSFAASVSSSQKWDIAQ